MIDTEKIHLLLVKDEQLRTGLGCQKFNIMLPTQPMANLKLH